MFDDFDALGLVSSVLAKRLTRNYVFEMSFFVSSEM